MIDRQQALGTFATSSPIAKTTASFSGSPAPKRPDRDECDARPRPRRRDQPRHPLDLRSSGLSSRSTRSESAAIRPSSVCMPVAKTTASRLAAGAARAAEDDVGGLEQRDAGVDRAGGAHDRHATRRSASTGRPRPSPRADERRRATRSPSRCSDDVAGHERRRSITVRRPSRSTVACGAGTPAAPRRRALPEAPARTRTRR